MFPYIQERRRIERTRALGAGVSGALHSIAFLALIHAPAVRLPQASESEYRQSIAGREQKIVWYQFRDKLPRVAPAQAQENGPLRAERRSLQPVVSSAAKAPKRPRMVWTPAPEIRDSTPPEAPNLIAVKLPPAPARPFVEPAPKPPAEAAVKLASTAPAITSASVSPARLPEVALAPKPFTPPSPAPPRAAGRIVTANAPVLARPLTPAAEKLDVTLAPKPFTAPPAASPAPVAQIRASDAPLLLASKALPNANFAEPALGAKPFTAPASTHLTALPALSIADAPAPPVLAANAKDLNLATVGLKPIDRPLPPPASIPADFSAGRQPRPDGANSQSAAGLAVPSLFVGQAGGAAKPDLLAQAFDAPTSAANLHAAMRSAPVSMPQAPADDGEATSHSGAVRVTDAPEPRFEGRDVFLMAIQMPNLTSYSGSWLMWYADRTRNEAGRATISPPVPHRKVDPKYIASAVADRVEGKVRLACVITRSGTVSGVELLRGLDDRLNQSAEEALAKWEFYPAMRKGEPVDVDVVVEIPFRLEPLASRP